MYYPYNLNLSMGQKEKLAKAIKNNSAVTIRLSKNNLKGNDEMMLTKTQINNIKKAINNGTGLDIKISKSHTRKSVKQGGNLFSALLPLARTALPMVGKTLGLSALAGLASEGASQVVKK